MTWQQLLAIAIPPSMALAGVALKVGADLVTKFLDWLDKLRSENTQQHSDGKERLDRIEAGVSLLQTAVSDARSEMKEIDDKLDNTRERIAHLEGRFKNGVAR